MDKLINLKHIGYTRAFMGIDNDISLPVFIDACKTYICARQKILFNDPIWERYSDEEIIVEYYSYLFIDNKSEREKFESSVDAASGSDTYDWLTSKVDELEAESEKKVNELPDRISFNPGVTD